MYNRKAGFTCKLDWNQQIATQKKTSIGLYFKSMQIHTNQNKRTKRIKSNQNQTYLRCGHRDFLLRSRGVRGRGYLLSHLQCISVLMRQLNSPYLVSNPIIQYGHALSCCRQQRSAFVRPPSSAYFFAEYPLPHHFVPGIRNRFRISRRLRRRWWL